MRHGTRLAYGYMNFLHIVGKSFSPPPAICIARADGFEDFGPRGAGGPTRLGAGGDCGDAEVPGAVVSLRSQPRQFRTLANGVLGLAGAGE